MWAADMFQVCNNSALEMKFRCVKVCVWGIVHITLPGVLFMSFFILCFFEVIQKLIKSKDVHRCW